MGTDSFPRWLNIWWWASFPLAAAFVGRMLYERTYLTWKYGKQMLGFVFVHEYPEVFFPTVLGFFLAHGWFIAALAFVLLRPARVSKADWVKIGLVPLCLIIQRSTHKRLFLIINARFMQVSLNR
jgi:hypothetical protein